MAERASLIALRGAPNFRDLGGLRGAEGRRVRHGAVFRSGHLGDLHEDDLAILRENLGTDICVVDLRGAAEREKLACRVPGALVHSLPIEPSVAGRLMAHAAMGEPLTPALARRFMCEAYEGFVRNAGVQLGAFLGHVQARGGRPLVVHCTAGKDRTGFMAAMLLGALGVPRAQIVEDYLRTNERVSPRESVRFAPEIMQVLGTVQQEFLEAALALVERRPGGLGAYLEQAAGFPAERCARLRAHLLA